MLHVRFFETVIENSHDKPLNAKSHVMLDVFWPAYIYIYIYTIINILEKMKKEISAEKYGI